MHASFWVEGVIIHIDKYNGNSHRAATPRPGGNWPSPIPSRVSAAIPASGSVTKPATLETGIEIRVPVFIKAGREDQGRQPKPGNLPGGP